MNVYTLDKYESPTQIAEDGYCAGYSAYKEDKAITAIQDSPYESSNAYIIWEKGFIAGWVGAKVVMEHNSNEFLSGKSHAA